jgi:hypothetical protein
MNVIPLGTVRGEYEINVLGERIERLLVGHTNH